ncbi:hypothetical protein [Humidisolicoccus flavus]|uniref:hypothetical protein n=1 Tax=Humidisolicoccus flavus TaxID=3111414 RepID=UPI00324F189C
MSAAAGTGATLGVILELMALIGFIPAAICAFAWAVTATIDGRWVAAPAELTERKGTLYFTWTSYDGQSQAARAENEAIAQFAGAKRREIYYQERNPERMRVKPRSGLSEMLRFLTLAAAGLGALAVVAGGVLMMLDFS